MIALASLLGLPGCIVDAVHQTAPLLLVIAHTTTTEALCPACQALSGRVHSRYNRTPRDLPIGGQVVRLVLQVHRFFCDNPNCSRRTFAERLPEFLPVKAQRTTRLTNALRTLGFALGGEAGARASLQLHLPFSPDSLLRIVRQSSLPSYPTPRVLGVDDFAFRKRHTYGTLLVDLEQRRPIDMLPDRSAETLATWLRLHPGVEVIARDRSTDYARGAADGAPTALQVADRWHLLQNIRETFERVIETLHARLRQHLSETAVPSLTHARQRLKPVSQDEALRRDQNREARYTRYCAVQRLKAAGLSHRAIAQRLKMSRGTVIQFARAAVFPERATRQAVPSTLDAYLPYLQQRWQAGCTNSSQLWRDIQAQGYSGKRIQVARWVRQQRTVPAPTTPRKYRATSQEAQLKSSQTTTQAQLPAPRELVWLAMREPAKLTETEGILLDGLRQEPTFDVAYGLVRRFVHLIRQEEGETLEQWIADCGTSNLRPLQSFAKTLQQDAAAVRAAITEPWSTGQVEGQITRVKLIKRQMYGRASFQLLRKRVLARA